jgi:hypothetical protein
MDQEKQKGRVVAVDPGASGGIAWRTPEGGVLCSKMPETEGDVLVFLKRFNPSEHTFFLEEVGGYIGKAQPGSAMFTFGRNTGFLIGAVMALGFRLEMVRPQLWQKRLGIGTSRTCASKTEWKNKLKAVAQRKFPTANVTLATSDALLILDYAETL